MRNKIIYIILSVMVVSAIVAQSPVGFSVAKITSEIWVKGVNVTTFFDNLSGNKTTSLSYGANSIDEDAITDNAIQNRHIEDMTIGWNELSLDARDSIRIGYSAEASIAADFLSVADTNELKTFTGYTSVFLEKVSSGTAVGAGWFVKKTSGYTANGITAFDLSGGGVLVRVDWLSNPGWLNSEWAGMVGDNSTVNDANFLKLINLANNLNANIEFPAGSFVVSDSFQIPNKSFKMKGQAIQGDSTANLNKQTTIRTTNSTKPILTIRGSVSTGLIRWVEISDIVFRGTGEHVSTANAIEIGSAAAYAGDQVHIKNCGITGFGKNAILVNNTAFVQIETCSIIRNGNGVKFESGILNSQILERNAIGLCDTAVWVGGSGGATVLINSGDMNYNKRFLHNKNGVVVMNGGNWESSAGNEFIYVEGGDLTINGTFFRYAGSGLNSPVIRIGNGGLCTVTAWQNEHTVIPVRLLSANALFYSNESIKVQYEGLAGGKSFRSEAIRRVAANAYLTGVDTTYFGFMRYTRRYDAADDRLELVWEDASGDVRTSNLIPQNQKFSSTGASHAYVSGVNQFIGRKSFNSSAVTYYTDVTVTVEPWATALYPIISDVIPPTAVSGDSTLSANFKVFPQSTNNVAGTVTFRVLHPGYTAAGVWQLCYRVEVKE